MCFWYDHVARHLTILEILITSKFYHQVIEFGIGEHEYQKVLFIEQLHRNRLFLVCFLAMISYGYCLLYRLVCM